MIAKLYAENHSAQDEKKGLRKHDYAYSGEFILQHQAMGKE